MRQVHGAQGLYLTTIPRKKNCDSASKRTNYINKVVKN